jgi:superfamily II DNA/RNA helicase
LTETTTASPEPIDAEPPIATRSVADTIVAEPAPANAGEAGETVTAVAEPEPDIPEQQTGAEREIHAEPVAAPVSAHGSAEEQPGAETAVPSEAEPAAAPAASAILAPSESETLSASASQEDGSAPDTTALPSLIPIVEGAPPEPPRAVFSDLGLSEEVVRAIDDMGYRHPTPIQEQAIPYVLMNRDVLGVAQTGTGKTASFTLPMIDILSGSRARARMPRSLILEPTRELALQVAENFVQYGKYLKLTHALIIGGESMSEQKDVLNRGVDVLIATPGRLLDMFDRGSILLSDTRLLVIDEADRMLDMGFIPDVERIVSLLPATRQTLFFSATMGPEIRRLVDAFQTNPKEIAVSRAASVATTITEGLALVAEHDKREALRRMIRSQNVQNALIFCNRKRDVDILYKSLTRHGFSVGALHGDLAQTVRFTTLEKFKANELHLLVCSDVAARGIDIGGLSHVFNFDVPVHAEDYVHRIGRTGRAGQEGKAFTIASPDDRYAVEQIEKLTGHPIPPVLVEGLDPVDWAESDTRKRRGRKTAAKKAPAEKAEKPRAERKRPERARAARPQEEHQEPVEVAAERPSHRDDLHRDEPRREEPRRAEQRRSDTRRDEGRRDESRRDDGRRGEARRDESRRYRRDDDLGPPVIGFGDDIPAFMFLRARPSQAAEPTPESDA